MPHTRTTGSKQSRRRHQEKHHQDLFPVARTKKGTWEARRAKQVDGVNCLGDLHYKVEVVPGKCFTTQWQTGSAFKSINRH
ncbi:hypothetical protein ZHAS_00006843 [Anopheles sinensis]|uniref:Uncharacterized protein n=1 Tax=Anopheles sinensis TaxID=74873 RepID=A0A084VN62_ANOSI|nr:hypothetical protein ZHAS_00006843 [Anopheles sinensis]